MLFEVMKLCRNFFTGEHEDGVFKIENGTVSLSFKSQYVLIEGSAFNDGLYAYPLEGLEDEEFNGCMTAVNPPKDFLSLVEEIEAYRSKYEISPFISESFGGYSYQRGTNGNGKPVSWADAFKDRLKVWTKI